MDPEAQYYGYSAPGGNLPDKSAKIKRIVFFVVAGFTVIFVLYAAYLLLFTKPSSKVDIVKLAAMHTEISRVSDLGLDSDRARRSTKHLAATTKIISVNNATDISNYVNSNFSTPISKANLGSEMNEEIDAILKEASELNTYDEKYIEVLKSLLSQTNKEMVRVYELVEDEEFKQLVNDIGSKNQAILDGIEN